jgi:hypothetical protein
MRRTSEAEIEVTRELELLINADHVWYKNKKGKIFDVTADFSPAEREQMRSDADDGVVSAEVTLCVTGTPVPYVPARTYGDPYDCYPAEGGYCEDVEVTWVGPIDPDTRKPRWSFEVDLDENFDDELLQYVDDRAQAAYEDAMESRAELAREREYDERD